MAYTTYPQQPPSAGAPAGQSKKKAAAVALVLVVVIAAISIGIGVAMTGQPAEEDDNTPPPYNPTPTPSTVDPAVLTGVTLGTDGNVVIAFEQSNPGFVPTFKLYRAAASFSTAVAATYIKTVTIDLIDPTDKKITDYAPPSGTWFYGITVNKPLGTGLGYAASAMSNVLSVAVGSAGPSTGPGTGLTTNPVMLPPVILSTTDVLSTGDFNVVFQTVYTKIYVYIATSWITESMYQTSYFTSIDFTQTPTTIHDMDFTLVGVTAAKYYIGLRAIDGTAISVLSNVMEMNVPSWNAGGGSTPTTLPGAPSGLGGSKVTGGTAPTVKLTWLPPANSGGSPIIGYNVYLRAQTTVMGQVYGADWFKITGTSGSSVTTSMNQYTTFLVSNSILGTQFDLTHEFYVTTVTAAGESTGHSNILYVKFGSDLSVEFSVDQQTWSTSI